MVKWATSLVLVLVMAGGLLAGVPVHFGGHGCSDMECCMTEMDEAPSHGAHEGAPAEKAGELYCFINCSDPTIPGQTRAVRQTAPSFSASTHPAAVQAPMVFPAALSRRRAETAPRQNSYPAYIRHLALLI